jgi:luciferase family oxidoreductase group 1
LAAEHHSILGLACSATPVLIGHIANATKTIRVSSGGVMLPNHVPLVVAEQFGTLESLFPGRIDLGLGRAPGSDGVTMRALRRDLHGTAEDFPELVQELRTYLGAPMQGAISGLSEQEVARDFSNAASTISLLAIGIAQSARRTLAIVG